MEWESSPLDFVYDHSYYCKSESFVCNLSWADGLVYFKSHAVQNCQAPNGSFEHTLLYEVDAQGSKQCILNKWSVKLDEQSVDGLFVKKYLIVGSKAEKESKISLFNENLKHISISNPKVLDEMLQVSYIDDILSLVTKHLIENSSYKITLQSVKALEGFVNKLFGKHKCGKQYCNAAIKLLAQQMVNFYHIGEELFLLDFAGKLDKSLQDDIIHVLTAKKPTYDLQNAISDNIVKYNNYVVVSVFTHYADHYDQINVEQFITFLKGSNQHTREIAFEKIHKDIKHISATKLDSFTKLLALDNQHNSLAKAYLDAYEYSNYILGVEYLENIESLLDNINYKIGAAKLFAASLGKAILNHSGDFKKIETHLDKLFDKSNTQNLPKSLIKAIFAFYHKDQSHFTKQVVTLLAEIKGIEVELLTKVKDVLLKISDKQAAIFIAKRLNEYHVILDQKEVRYFIEFLKDTSAIKLSAMNFLCSVFHKYDNNFRIEVLTKLIECVDNVAEYNKISKIVESLNDESLKQLFESKFMLISNKYTENLENILILAENQNNFSLIQIFLKKLLHSQSKSNIGIFNKIRNVLEKNSQWNKMKWSDEENGLLSLINSPSHEIIFGSSTFVLNEQQKKELDAQLIHCNESLLRLTFDSYEDILDLISFVNANKIEKDILEAALLKSTNDTTLYINLLISLLQIITKENSEFDAQQYLGLLYNGNFQCKTLYTVLKAKNFILLDRIIEYNLSEIDTGRDGKSVGQIISKNGSIDSINRVIRDNRFFVPKNDETILQEMLEYNSDNKEILSLLEGGYYKTQLDKIKVLKNDGVVNGKRLSEWNKIDFQEYSKKSLDINDDTIAEFLYIISEAAYRTVLKHIGYPREVQLIAALSLYKSEGGGLAQIETGEGKSLIITIFNILKNLEHHDYKRRIDVVTTSPVLAIRDTENLKELYEYFGITVACNIRGRCVDTKEAYKADIVYGTLIHFIGDVLRDINTDTRSGRGFDLLVIDEVDNLLIDQINMKVQLSSAVPGMEMVNQVLMYMFWTGIDSATNIKQHGSDGCYFHPPQLSDEQIEIIEKFQNETFSKKLNNNIESIRIGDDCNNILSNKLKEYTKVDLLESKILTIPKHLESFALGAVQRWIDSLLTSVIYKEDVEYMLVNSQKDTGYNFTITCPIDAQNTGTILYRLHLSDGLQQFLSLKHRLPLTAETFTTTFMSYYGYFSKYKGSIYGVTGTLGDQLDREYLKSVYDVKLINIPRFIGRDFRILNPVIANENTWIEKIVHSAAKNAQTRSVLIILETLDKVEAVYTALKSSTKLQVKIYGRDHPFERKMIEEELQVGDVIVASNLAGRGTDLKLSPEVIKNGGLHVIVGTFPKHLRVEDQAYGRAARKEEPGSGQMILNLDHINSTCSDITCLYKKEQNQNLLY